MKTILQFGSILILLAAGPLLAQDAENLTRSERSLLQPEQQIEVASGGFNKADNMTGDWGGYRQRLFDSGIEVFLFYNSILNGNVAGGFDPLAWSAGVMREGEGLPAGTTPASFYTTCMVSNQPVETIAYLTLVHHQPCVVITHDHTTWIVENGKITKDQKRK